MENNNKFTDEKLISLNLYVWDRFIEKGKNTEFLTEIEFQLILDSKNVVLNYETINFDNKNVIIKRRNQTSIEKDIRVFDRLQEIYNQRFNNDTDQTEKLTNFERLYWFNKIGGFDLPIFKNQDFSNENRDKIIGKVLGMNPRDVKSFINNDTKNPLTDADKIKMNKDFANLTKAKNKN
jgi:hypothetical protein